MWRVFTCTSVHYEQTVRLSFERQGVGGPLPPGPDGVMNRDVTNQQIEESANHFYDQLMAGLQNA